MPDGTTPAPAGDGARDFIRDIVAADRASGRWPGIVTRFPPEPNGYLHIGHAKSICLNFGIALENGGRCNLRLDDTNPAREQVEYVDAIIADVQWLIHGWADGVLGLKPRGAPPVARTVDGRSDFLAEPAAPAAVASGAVEPFFASDYFDQIHGYAVELIRRGKAYICDLSPEAIETYRGAPDRPGRESPWRGRSVEENLDLFARMRAGEFPDAARTLRAKIDMTSPNIWMRDPLLYRIRHLPHHQTGDRWPIYPLYDFAHCLSDYLEGITHSICTLEFEVHRPLYDWILENLGLPRPLPRQYEFARLNLGYTVMSKRKLLQLVQEGAVSGWNDPRMPTVAGLRRRGVPAEAVRAFAQAVGVTKYNGITDIAVLEHAIRESLNRLAIRRLAVLRPLKVVVTNLAPGETLEFDAVNHPEDPSQGMRKVAFTRDLFIEQDDFMEVPPPKYFRLRPGGEVRLKYACIIRCDEIVKGPGGEVVELRCTADFDTRTGGPNAARKVKAAIHWVSAERSATVEVRLYDRLFSAENPDESGDFRSCLNPDSLTILNARVEEAMDVATGGQPYQFERLGYFQIDPVTSRPEAPVFNRIIGLKDAWTKAMSKQA